ncbi:unnamed protein product [Mycena citricolor]|uniref:EthD domain-containing protein n=1 Tax=Mycena citricolor TaxID=2018698 RepID=A0AAD2GRP9_9AGAR|nr:unnamed protein product [Mycena citricolor]
MKETASDPASISHPRKKARKDRSSRKRAQAAAAAPLPSSHFLKLPFELLAEVFQYAKCPRTVLSASRCNKYLYNTLKRPESAFIWRFVRNNCLPEALPDPAPMNLTEPVYAAMVFDGGPCTNCEEHTFNLYSSWSIRARFCNRPKCMNEWAENNVLIAYQPNALDRGSQKALTWIPLLESDACLDLHKRKIWTHHPSQLWPRTMAYLKKDMDTALAELRSANVDVVEARHKDEILRQSLRMPFFVALWEWRKKRADKALDVKIYNDAFGKALAAKEGYVYGDLLNASITYNNLYHQRRVNLELITTLDYNVRAPKIEAEMLYFKERNERRSVEASRRANAEAVTKHHERLLTDALARAPRLALPTLAHFRTFPIIQTMYSPTGKAADMNLKGDNVVNQMITSALEVWRAQVQEQFGAMLGFSKWKTARSNRLHPTMRVTARWICTKCHFFPKSYAKDRCFDFFGACQHECSKTGKRGHSTWSVEQFAKDDRAVNAVTKAVELCEIDAADRSAPLLMDIFGARILCLSCPVPIVMHPLAVIGHSHRHEAMEMSLLSESEANAILVAPVDKGLGLKVMRDHLEPLAKRDEQLYGCRHCVQGKPDPKNGHERRKLQKRLVNGLRSHLKSSSVRLLFFSYKKLIQLRHGIDVLGDEDIYPIPSQNRDHTCYYPDTRIGILSAVICSMPVRVLVFVKRLPHISFEDFDAHWANIHGPLFAALSAVQTGKVKYKQFHVDPAMSENLAAAGITVATYDGISEFEAESLDDILGTFKSEEYKQNVLPDEANFFERTSVQLLAGKTKAKF